MAEAERERERERIEQRPRRAQSSELYWYPLVSDDQESKEGKFTLSDISAKAKVMCASVDISPLPPNPRPAWQHSRMKHARADTGTTSTLGPMHVALKEGRKITHPWQPTRLNGWNSVCACHQHDILSRQAMMYLLTMGWFLAHTSLAMTPEHSAIKGENSSLRSA